MRKMLVLALGVALIAPLAFAQTNVLSQNAVGYVKVTIGAGTLEMLRYDFLDIDGNVTYAQDVFGAQLPFGSRVYTWNGNGFDFDQYNQASKTTPEGWAPNTAPIVPGVGFFLEVPVGAPDPSYDVMMLGEVPGANNSSETTDIGLAEAFTLTGYPYPATVDFTNTAMATGADVGDRMLTWNGAGYDFISYNQASKTTPEGWSGTVILEPGVGFFYDNLNAARTATETKPYSWP